MSLINLTRGFFLGAVAFACGASLAPGGLRAEPVASGSGAAGSGAVVAAARTDFSAALHAALDDPEAGAFYTARGDAPLWTAGDGARAAVLIATLRAGPSHALPAARYAPDALAAALTRSDDAGRGAAEAALTRAYLAYARDVSSGVLEPRSVARDIKVAPPRPRPGVLLRAAAAAPNMVAHLAALAPADPGYAALRERYRALSALAAAGDWGATIPPGATLRPGDAGPRVAALRARLNRLGDLAPDAPAADAARFDAALAAAVRRFQARHGLNEDGAVGPATLAAINTSARFRAGQLAVNLERMRWMNRPLGARRIVVNQPDYTVTLFDGDKVLFRERVVVGQVRFKTPEFSDEMEYLVLNPTWHLPRSIATKELLPLLQEDPSVLARRGMRLVRTDGGPLPLDPSSHDFSGYTARNFPYSVKQAPSGDNALGRVKFMFPNGDSIYLHDTPTKRYFARDVRALSHGCVRVQDPLRLATLLLAPQQADPRGFIDAVLASGRERFVYLERPVPVHLTYRTAWVDEIGALQLRADIYDRDAAALAALSAAGVAAPGA